MYVCCKTNNALSTQSAPWELLCFYIDVRSNGKNYEEFVRRAQEKEGAQYIRGRVSAVYKDGPDMVVEGADTLTNSQIKVKCDLVVLATAMEAPDGIKELAQKLGIGYDQHGFLTEAHPKLKPVETATAGIFLAGCALSPRDIPDSVSEASGAASKVLGLLSKDSLEKEGVVAVVNEASCVACQNCIRVCPYNAIELKDICTRGGEVIRRLPVLIQDYVPDVELVLLVALPEASSYKVSVIPNCLQRLMLWQNYRREIQYV